MQNKDNLALQLADRSQSPLLDTDQAAALLNTSVRFLKGTRAKDAKIQGPPFCRLSSRLIRYRLSDLQAWIEDRLKSSAAED